jgi:malonyl-CoA/methylmalonyl-CoA synthetase
MNPLASRLIDTCLRHGGRLALDDGEEALRYAELLDAAHGIARALEEAGIEDHEPVPVAVSNRARDVAALLGVWRAGGVAVPVHRQTAPAVLAALTRRTGARLVVNARPDLQAPGSLAAAGPVIGPAGPAPHPRALLDGAALVVFTSGSTGEPKGTVISAARLCGKLDMIARATGFEEGVHTLLALQLTFSFGQWVTLLSLLRGGVLVMRSRFDPRAVITDLARERIRRAPMVPTMMRALLPLAESGSGRGWGGVLMAGGEALPATVGRRLLAAWPGCTLGDIYGLTETGTCDFFVRPEEYHTAAGTIGRAGPDIDWRIADDGELQIRSPWAMVGYLDAPAMTEAAFRDGFFRTGDVARLRTDGRVELVGRAKEMIVRAGNKVAPMEVERVFLGHPEIEAALATGLPDERVGEAVHLLVVPTAGTAPDPARLRAWAAERLERWKLPDRIHLGTALPTGHTGKADRRALARELLDSPPQGEWHG